MKIRNFQPGDESAQVEVYNTAAAVLPKFKPATTAEVHRRVQARDFDPGQRFYAVEGGRVVGYCVFCANGRVSHPWCLPGYEHTVEPLFHQVLAAAEKSGLRKVFAAYRGDWPAVHNFFQAHGFALARSMVNYFVEFLDMPTPAVRASGAITPLVPADVPFIHGLMPATLRVGPEELRKHLFNNPYFDSEGLFGLRNRQLEVIAAGIVVYKPTYADPQAVDAAMPCFRLGAFGTEGMQTKRLKGLFSFVAKPDVSLPALAMDLMGHASYLMRDNDDLAGLAAQVPSDAPALLGFYEQHFRKQGSFPVFERTLSP
jgi:hypothetical protein